MADVTIRIHGLRETLRALQDYNREASKDVRDALREAVEPVAATARQRLGRYQGISLGTIGPRASTRGAFVTQRAKKVTGRRGDFGALQMTRGLIPAMQQHADEIREEVEDALDRLGRKHGF